MPYTKKSPEYLLERLKQHAVQSGEVKPKNNLSPAELAVMYQDRSPESHAQELERHFLKEIQGVMNSVSNETSLNAIAIAAMQDKFYVSVDENGSPVVTVAKRHYVTFALQIFAQPKRADHTNDLFSLDDVNKKIDGTDLPPITEKDAISLAKAITKEPEGDRLYRFGVKQARDVVVMSSSGQFQGVTAGGMELLIDYCIQKKNNGKRNPEDASTTTLVKTSSGDVGPAAIKEVHESFLYISRNEFSDRWREGCAKLLYITMPCTRTFYYTKLGQDMLLFMGRYKAAVGQEEALKKEFYESHPAAKVMEESSWERIFTKLEKARNPLGMKLASKKVAAKIAKIRRDGAEIESSFELG